MSNPPAQPKPLPTFNRDFRSVVGLANWLRTHCYQVNPTLPVNIAEGSVWPGLKTAVQKYRHNKPIERFYVKYLSSLSVHIEYPDRYEILIPESFNPCHKRFALCKELCHILTDDTANKFRSPIDQLNRALRTNKTVVDARESDLEISGFFWGNSLSTEDFCFLLALEMLIPIKHREQILTDVLIRGKNTYNVAVELRIPQKLVDFFVNSGYVQVFKRVGGTEYKL